MLNELIEKIAAQTGLPAATVQPVVGAMLAHLGDILPAPIAHQVAIMLGIHPADAQAQTDASGAAPAAAGAGLGGLLGNLAGALAAAGGGTATVASATVGSSQTGGGQFAGAGALASVAESLLAGFLANRR